MLYRKIPKTGDELSILGFGCMRLPMIDGRIDEDRAIRQIRSAIDAGVNYLDTAWPYHGGESERVLGLALRDGYRERVRIATKLPTWLVSNRADMDSFLNRQLEKLGTDHIDYYLLHALDGASWDGIRALDVAGFLDQAKEDGRIVNRGFSFHGLADDFARIVDGYGWEFCQIQYNYLDQEFQAGTRGLEYAASRGLGVIIMEPLRGGNLGLASAPDRVAAIWDEAQTKRSPVEWALRWVWNHPEVTVVLSGMNEESHVAQNMAIAAEARAGSLTASELALVDRAAATYTDLMQVGCTGCGYCMPCPMNVQIPVCFSYFNKLSMFGSPDEVKRLYIVFAGGVVNNDGAGFASQCVQCGQCLEKCPQQIDIPAMLERVVETMEGPGFEDHVAMISGAMTAARKE